MDLVSIKKLRFVGLGLLRSGWDFSGGGGGVEDRLQEGRRGRKTGLSLSTDMDLDLGL